MKSNILIILFFFLVSNYALSQSKVLLRGGVNYSTLFNSLENDLEPFSTHINVGFGLEQSFSKNISFLIESLFSVKGHNNFTDGSLAPEVPKHLHLSYLSFPVSLNFHLTAPLKLKFGGEANYLTFKKVHFSDENNNSASQKFDFGILGGIRFSLNKDVEIGLNYYHGINKAIVLTEEEYFKNRNFQFYIGCLFE